MKQKLALLDKHKYGAELSKQEDHALKGYGRQVVATITARYGRGISGDCDNVVVTYERR